MRKFFKFIFLGIFIFFSCYEESIAVQTDTLDTEIGGLKFLSQQVYSSERTSFLLFPQKAKLASEFTLSFDCNIYDISKYGYVFRIIEEREKKNESKIHLLFINSIDDIDDNSSSEIENRGRLELYSPITNKKIQFIVDEVTQNEMRINIYYNADNKQIVMNVNGVEKILPGVDLDVKHSNIIFGLWGKNNDVAAMHLRNVRLREKGETKYFWPLNEYEGTYAEEKLHKTKSNVKNPVWLRNQHYFWEELKSFQFDEMVGIIFKQKEQNLYFVNKDSMLVYSPQTENLNVIKYFNERPFSKEWHFSTYNNAKDEIISYDFEFFGTPKQKPFFSVFNDENLTWSEIATTAEFDVRFHHNLCWNKKADEVTTFGGYGNYDYFSEFETFNFSKNEWRTTEIKGDEIYPRTHSVMGVDYQSNLFYLYGGFGNEEGKQEMGGRTFYDLYEVNLETGESKELLNFEDEELDFVPRGQLLVENSARDFFTLGSKMIEKSYLRLYHINIANESIEAVTDSIPALYSNMAGDAYLFKDEIANELYCVVRNNSKPLQSLVSVYRLRFPPSTLEEKKQKPTNYAMLLGIIFFIVICLTVAFILFTRKKERKAFIEEKSTTGGYTRKNKNAIWFLGGYKVFDPKGKDITYRFSKKLKELFILVFFETVNNEGINSQQLSEILWPGMDKTHQKNNRGVTINNLRKALEDLNGIKLVNINNKWKIECTDECYFDFLEVKKAVNNNEPVNNEFLISMFSFGKVLPHLQFDWLDKFKALYENQALSALYDVCHNYYDQKKFLSCFESAKIIDEKFDSLDEVALNFKVKSLIKMKSKTKAFEEYELFKKRYLAVYKEQYSRAYTDIENSHYNSND